MTRRFRLLPAILFFAAFAATVVLPRASASTAYFQQAGSQASGIPVNQQLVKESREAAGEEGDNQFKHSASVQWIAKVTGLSLEAAYLLCVLLNFVVIAGVIFWFSKKNLPVMFRKRTASIQKAMEEARKASADANRRLAEIEARLSRLDAEIAEMTASAAREGAAEEQRIKTAAEEDARKIVQAAEQEMVAAAKAVRRELTAYAADLAVALATKQIHVDAATDQALVRGFAQQLPASGEQKGRQ